jgi:hypothetical protein
VFDKNTAANGSVASGLFIAFDAPRLERLNEFTAGFRRPLSHRSHLTSTFGFVEHFPSTQRKIVRVMSRINQAWLCKEALPDT